jgi:hypothetical protein
MGALMGVEVKQALRLTMYNSWSDMRGALPPRSQVQQEALITEGVLFPSTGVILVLGTVPRAAGVTSHEVVHFLMDQAMGGMTRILPAWLNEGLAEYGSTEPSATFDAALSRALAQGRLFPLTSLTAPPGRPEDVLLMYGQGKSVVTFLVERHGAEKLRTLIQKLRQGLPIDEALQAAYGFDRDGLDQRWRQSIGAPPLTQDGPSRVTPTPIPYPTIIPFGAETPTPFPSPATPRPAPTPARGGACGRGQGAGDAALLGAAALGLALVVTRRIRR